MSGRALRYAARSDVGLIRQGNEDSGYAGAHMLVVADGMGGHAAGELASSTAVAVLAELDRPALGEQVLEHLDDAVSQVHERLVGVVSSSPEAAGMGTTITALAWEGDRLAIAHVGDSRAYLLRDGRLHQLTTDHTYVQTLVDAGRITPEQAAVHHKRNLLIRAVDGVHAVEPDLSIRQAEAGDRYLLCTDGLTGVVAPAELRALLSNGDPTGAVTALVDRALEAGAPDNVTCVVADVVVEGDQALEAGAAEVPVVVGAAAQWRNRDRLPGIAFPADSEPDPTRPPAAGSTTGEATDKAIRVGRPRRTWWAAIAAVLAVAVVAAAGGWYWAQQQYFVSDSNGYVAIYRGVAVGTGPHGWSRVVAETDTAVSSLPLHSQEQVQEAIPARGLDGARDIVAALQAQAVTCRVEPTTPGCPTAPPPTEAGPGSPNEPAAEEPTR
ncbi:MAG: protein phosphatase 2C domain-containing protein [Candidatus Nanopelagicales bacterium]|nr:protein phosphatase 2C domain-containing protein [Candidatus Nanopelagicales bacterium]